MKKALFTPMMLAFLVLVILVLLPNKWIEGMIPENRIDQASTELNPFMFQGKYVQQKMLEDKHFLPIYGSSELARLDRFHPVNYFKETGEDFTPFLVGRGGTESLIHFLNFSEHTDQLKGKKIVFVLSPQWFQPNGTDESHFAPNYSSLQGYDLAFNKKVNPTVKKMAIQRLLTFSPIKNDPMLSIMFKAEITNDPWTKRGAAIVRPFASAYRDLMVKKDLYYTLAGGTSRNREISSKVNNMSWEQLAVQAEQVGKRKSTNNPFYVSDYQYDKIKKMVPSLKDKKGKASYGKSPEYDDFQLVLDLLKESGAQPLFISVPVNGNWYDYTGFPKEGRTSYYERIKKQIESEGFQIADFSDHEYDPYFMKDTIHIGWKGWVYTDKAIKEFYEGKEISTKLNQ
ncbi:D-alanyl-lipoteichoic acid biosynthesis protein DltD [Neobacillus vireti]|uniref:Protein DltD n=1 Tax=Neobacillus vireti LMG 21834 TaxID=1131730 RepID=A0AB94ITE8_9BACI|nr:D-alanyl-lipoteichoic acid biosynthesis protein DltD [Neobacillus vireti]ETI70233.1 putative D-alanine esterase for lipoteichoic acid and wall teichoic acid synthesis [Neobacillus vireti LMG 21834]KLT19739.1 alanine transporter [Neobacillus vireti]